MEVTAGFKHTELGDIPNEWNLIPLEKIADPSKKWSFTGGPFGSNLKSSDYTQDGVRVIQLQNIGDGVFHNESEIYTSHEKANELLSCNIYPNEIILSKMGDPVARASIIPNFHDRYLMCSDGIRLSVNPKEHNNYFIFLSLNFNYFRKQAESASTGSTRKRIGLCELRQLNVICPKIDEQNAIAEALSDADALIESLEKLIEKKRQIKQGVMQKFFNENSIGEVVPLEEISSLKGRIGWQGLKQSEFTDNHDEPYLITGMNFKDGEIRWNEVYHISEERYEIAKEIQLKPDDVLMTKDGTIGKMLFIDNIPYPHKASLNSHILLLRPLQKKYYPKYLYYQMTSKRFKDFIELSKSGTTFFGISQASVGKYPVLLPPLNEQIKIAEILSDIDKEIDLLEVKLLKACQIKQGMMQELLTGRIRLV